MPAPAPNERAGARVYKATAEASVADPKTRRDAIFRKAPDIDKGSRVMAQIVHDGIGRVEPTGQHTGTSVSNEPGSGGQPVGVADAAGALAYGTLFVAQTGRWIGRKLAEGGRKLAERRRRGGKR